jgi:hypothetical protein
MIASSVVCARRAKGFGHRMFSHHKQLRLHANPSTTSCMWWRNLRQVVVQVPGSCHPRAACHVASSSRIDSQDIRRPFVMGFSNNAGSGTKGICDGSRSRWLQRHRSTLNIGQTSDHNPHATREKRHIISREILLRSFAASRTYNGS